MAVRVYFLPGGRALAGADWDDPGAALPRGPFVDVERGTSLFAAARRLGLPVGHACAAEGICGKCGLRVLSGSKLLSPESAIEADLKARNRVSPSLRLSCFARVLALDGLVYCTADYW